MPINIAIFSMKTKLTKIAPYGVSILQLLKLWPSMIIFFFTLYEDININELKTISIIKDIKKNKYLFLLTHSLNFIYILKIKY